MARDEVGRWLAFERVVEELVEEVESGDASPSAFGPAVPGEIGEDAAVSLLDKDGKERGITVDVVALSMKEDKGPAGSAGGMQYQAVKCSAREFNLQFLNLHGPGFS